VVVGKNKAEGAKAILMNGPQCGCYLPGYVYITEEDVEKNKTSEVVLKY